MNLKQSQSVDSDMPCSDQSTQVNFPIINTTLPRIKKRLQRYNTTHDLWARSAPNINSNNNGIRHSSRSTQILNKNGIIQNGILQNGGSLNIPTSNNNNNIHNMNNNSNTPPISRPRSLILHTSNLQNISTQATGVSNSSELMTPSTRQCGALTPNDASSVSLDSTPSASRCAGPYYGHEILSIDNEKKWQGPISAYNFGKVWKYNTTVKTPIMHMEGADTLSTRYMETMPTAGNSTCGCQCQCGDRFRARRDITTGMEPPWMTLQNSKQDSPEGLSWRRLHMSRAKLKATATTSELLSGFAMVAMVELQINEPTEVPEWLFVMFSVCTTVLVAVHIFALMISTYLLPNIDAISKLEVASLVHESPHERMRGFIELAWAFSTVFGLFLFLVEIAILCWVKFWDFSFIAAMAATVIVIPVLCIFVAFAIHFYHSLVIHKCESSVSEMEQLEDMKRKLDNAVSPV